MIRPIHPGAVAALQASTPQGSVPHGLARVAALGRLGWARADAGPPTTLVAPRGGGAPRVHVGPDAWPGIGNADAELGLLWDVAARWLSDPGPSGRSALADAIGANGPPALPPVPDDPEALAAALDGLDGAQDPLRLHQGALLAAWHDGVPLDSPRLHRAAWRAWIACGGRAPDGPHPARADGAAWAEAGEVFLSDDGYWLPRSPPCTTAPTDLHAVVDRAATVVGVVGVVGAAGAGKSTLVRAIADRARQAGRTVVHVAGDQHTWDGPGLRYVQHAGHRVDLLDGPGLYDDRSLTDAVRAARNDGELVLVDGVFLGLDPSLRAAIDLLVLATADDARRLVDKRRRDDAPGSVRRIDVTTDFVAKVFREGWEVQRRLERSADARVHRA